MSFLDLPAEMRNQIYKYSLLKSDYITLLNTKPFIEEPALLMTSKKVRNEALAIFYGNNTFEIHKIDTFTQFLQLFNPGKQALIRQIHTFGLAMVYDELPSGAAQMTVDWMQSQEPVSWDLYLARAMKRRSYELMQEIPQRGRWCSCWGVDEGDPGAAL